MLLYIMFTLWPTVQLSGGLQPDDEIFKKARCVFMRGGKMRLFHVFTVRNHEKPWKGTSLLYAVCIGQIDV